MQEPQEQPLKHSKQEIKHLIVNLPSWIKYSEFVRQYEEDFPGEEVFKLDNNERLFELPLELCEDSVVKVMDNIRYFGISDDSLAVKQLVEFYIKNSNRHLIDLHKESFPELKVLWGNVDLNIKVDELTDKVNVLERRLASKLYDDSRWISRPRSPATLE